MAVASMHLGVWSWSRQSPELQTEALRTLSVSIQFNKKMFYTVNFTNTGRSHLWKILRQFWRRKGVKHSISIVFLIIQVSVKLSSQMPILQIISLT